MLAHLTLFMKRIFRKKVLLQWSHTFCQYTHITDSAGCFGHSIKAFFLHVFFWAWNIARESSDQFEIHRKNGNFPYWELYSGPAHCLTELLEMYEGQG